MFGFENSNQIKNIVREGKVSKIYAERHSCRVIFEDRGGLTSAEMPVLTLCAKDNKSYWMPCINEKVVCLMNSSDLSGGGGYVIGSLYTSEEKPEENNQNTYSLKFSDAAKFSYQRKTDENKSSEFKMQFADGSTILFQNDERDHNFEIKFSDGCAISYSYGNNDAEFEMKFANGDKFTHDGRRGDAELNISGELNISARGDVNIKGANIHLN